MAEINEDGCLVLLPNLARQHGLKPGARIRIEGNTNRLTLLRPATQLAEAIVHLQEFNFSPCIQCGGCDFFESNQEDCIGSPMPACGGCLWAQGVIQCP